MARALISNYYDGLTAHSHYLHPVFIKEEFSEMMRRTVRLARMMKRAYKYDTIVFTGMSGALVSSAISLAIDSSLVCIRKNEDSSHYPFNFEGNPNVKNYIIVDDFISGGATVRNLLSKMKKAKPDAVCKAILLYKSRQHKQFAYDGNMINIHCSNEESMEYDPTPSALLKMQSKN